MRRAWIIIGILVYGLVLVWCFRHWWPVFSNTLAGDTSGDGILTMWQAFWPYHYVKNLFYGAGAHFSYLDTNAFVGIADSYGLSDMMPGLLPIVSLLQLIGLSPVLTINVIQLFAILLWPLSIAWFARCQIARSHAEAILAGLIALCAPLLFDNTLHLQMQFGFAVIFALNSQLIVLSHLVRGTRIPLASLAGWLLWTAWLLLVSTYLVLFAISLQIMTILLTIGHQIYHRYKTKSERLTRTDKGLPTIPGILITEAGDLARSVQRKLSLRLKNTTIGKALASLAIVLAAGTLFALGSIGYFKAKKAYPYERIPVEVGVYSLSLSSYAWIPERSNILRRAEMPDSLHHEREMRIHPFLICSVVAGIFALFGRQGNRKLGIAYIVGLLLWAMTLRNYFKTALPESLRASWLPSGWPSVAAIEILLLWFLLAMVRAILKWRRQQSRSKSGAKESSEQDSRDIDSHDPLSVDRPRERTDQSIGPGWIVPALLVVLLLVSMGPFPDFYLFSLDRLAPYNVLTNLVYGFSKLRALGRLGIVIVGLMAPIAARGIAIQWNAAADFTRAGVATRTIVRAMIALLLILALLDGLPWSWKPSGPLPALESYQKIYESRESHTRPSILITENSAEATGGISQWFALQSGMGPVLGGNSGIRIDPYVQLYYALQSNKFSPDEKVAIARAAGVGTIDFVGLDVLCPGTHLQSSAPEPATSDHIPCEVPVMPSVTGPSCQNIRLSELRWSAPARWKKGWALPVTLQGAFSGDRQEQEGSQKAQNTGKGGFCLARYGNLLDRPVVARWFRQNAQETGAFIGLHDCEAATNGKPRALERTLRISTPFYLHPAAPALDYLLEPPRRSGIYTVTIRSVPEGELLFCHNVWME
ncbi:MAG: hypothetical protein KDK33_12380 [Leptospiraceae bacterium]|nr:hypothetical protein [Leptospiraceae bacterium]